MTNRYPQTDGGDERQMHGQIEVNQKDRSREHCVAEGCCHGDSKPKMSLLFGLILPSVHFDGIKTASNTLRVKGGEENENRLLEKTRMRRRAGGISFPSVSL